MLLSGKNILITGASRGLGRQLAIDFARNGASGLALVARNSKLLNDLCDELKGLAPNTVLVPIVADVSNANDLERIASVTLSAFEGKLDVLINNAATLGPTPMPWLVDYPADQFNNVLQTNLVAPFVLIQKVLAALVETKGSIINVSSDAGIQGYPGFGAYGISKFAIEGLSQTWAAELSETGVRVNVVDPGDMNTEMHRAAEPEEDPRQWANPKDVTGVFVFLASDKSVGTNGQRFLAQEEEVAA
jgi:NAD(P)-dependent dehydrogenase (short-subunit alcohol dehydrogenase family)